MKISILIPTRLRANRLLALIQNIDSTVAQKDNIEILFCIEPYDIETIKLKDANLNPNIKWIIHDTKANNTIFSNLTNILYTHSTGEIILIGADDIMFHLQDWDNLVRECFNKYPDKILLVNPRDGIQNGAIAPHFFIHKNWIDTIGYVVPPLFKSWYNDTWVTSVAQGLNRYIYLPEFFLEHLHPCTGKTKEDVTSKEKNAGIPEDHKIWLKTGDLRAEDVKKLQTFIEEYNKND